MMETQRIYDSCIDLRQYRTKKAALLGAVAIVIVIELQAFKALNFDFIKQQLGSR